MSHHSDLAANMAAATAKVAELTTHVANAEKALEDVKNMPRKQRQTLYRDATLAVSTARDALRIAQTELETVENALAALEKQKREEERQAALHARLHEFYERNLQLAKERSAARAAQGLPPYDEPKTHYSPRYRDEWREAGMRGECYSW